MERITDEQIKNMVGTEYLHVFYDRSEIPAVVAAFDPQIGITCLATCLIDSVGDNHDDRVDGNGNFCLTGYSSSDLKDEKHRANISFVLRSIKNLGYYKALSEESRGYNNWGGSAQCSFS